MACFAIGVAALLWVFRRTIQRARNPIDANDVGSFNARFITAGSEIDDISAREWLATWRRAMKFERGAPALSTAQQAHLAQLSAWQSTRRGTEA